MRIDVGNYTGNGTSQTVSLTNITGTPDLVFVKGNAYTQGRYRTNQASAWDSTDESAQPIGSTENTSGITAIRAGEFDVGSDLGVNTNGAAFYWFAIYDDGEDDFAMLEYSGDSDTGGTRDITDGDVGFTPSCALILEKDGGLGWRTKNHTSTNSKEFGSSETSDGITALISDGFTIDDDGWANTGTGKRRVILFGDVTGAVDAVRWTGDGNDDRDISIDSGVTPEVVLAHNNSQSGYHSYGRWEGAGGMSGDVSVPWYRIDVQVSNAIQEFKSGAFEVGNIFAGINYSGWNYDAVWLIDNPASGGGVTVPALDAGMLVGGLQDLSGGLA